MVEPKSEKSKDIKLGKSNFVNYKKGNIETEYELRETLGSGAFAKVVKVLHKKSGQYRALKIIKKQKDQDPARMYLEVEILKKLVHPNIMQIFEFYEDKKHFQIITELCEGGELFDMIVEKGSFKRQPVLPKGHRYPGCRCPDPRSIACQPHCLK